MNHDIVYLPDIGSSAFFFSRRDEYPAISLLTNLVCAGVDLPPGQRESAFMEGGAADVIFEGQERKVKMRLEIVYLPIMC